MNIGKPLFPTLVIAALCTVGTGCSSSNSTSDNGNPSQNPIDPGFVFDNLSDGYKTGSIASLSYSNLDLTDAILNARTEDGSVVLVAELKGNLLMLIPELEVGDHILSLRVNLDEYEIPFSTLESEPFENGVDSYLLNTLSQLHLQLESIDTLTDSGPQSLAYKNQAQSSLGLILTSLDTFSEQDKLTAAFFVQNNFPNIKTLLDGIPPQIQSCSERANELGTNTGFLETAIRAVNLGQDVPTPAGTATAIIAGSVGWTYIANALPAIADLPNHCVEITGLRIGEENQILHFFDGQETQLPVFSVLGFSPEMNQSITRFTNALSHMNGIVIPEEVSANLFTLTEPQFIPSSVPALQLSDITINNFSADAETQPQINLEVFLTGSTAGITASYSDDSSQPESTEFSFTAAPQLGNLQPSIQQANLSAVNN